MAAGGLWFCLHSLLRSDINEYIQKAIKHVPDDNKSVVIILFRSNVRSNFSDQVYPLVALQQEAV